MTTKPYIRPPGGGSASVASLTGPEAERQLPADLQTLREIVAGLDRLDERLDKSPIPAAIAQRGYFTPDEDDRVRQGVLIYRNYRLAAYEIILRYRNYASVEPQPCRLRCFLVAFGAALVLYAKSLKIIAFAEHVPMLRAKINEPDRKYDLEAGFFDDVLAGYSRLGNYQSVVRADGFWRAHRREAQAFAAEAGEDWVWLVDLIRRQRHAVRNRLLHVLWERLCHDWRAFCETLLSPFRRARHGVEGLLSVRLTDAESIAPPVRIGSAADCSLICAVSCSLVTSCWFAMINGSHPSSFRGFGLMLRCLSEGDRTLRTLASTAIRMLPDTGTRSLSNPDRWDWSSKPWPHA